MCVTTCKITSNFNNGHGHQEISAGDPDWFRLIISEIGCDIAVDVKSYHISEHPWAAMIAKALVLSDYCSYQNVFAMVWGIYNVQIHTENDCKAT